MRIVKKDAKLHDHSNMNGDCCFFYDDTVLLDKNYRPEDYKNPYKVKHDIDVRCGHDVADYESGCHDGFEAGFQACLEAMEKI